MVGILLAFITAATLALSLCTFYFMLFNASWPLVVLGLAVNLAAWFATFRACRIVENWLRDTFLRKENLAGFDPQVQKSATDTGASAGNSEVTVPNAPWWTNTPLREENQRHGIR